MSARLWVGLLGILPLVAALAPQQQDAAAPQPPAIFHSGTRLVEVEVVVRGKRVRPPGMGEALKWIFDSGPPYGPPGPPLPGLTKDDFSLFDEGKQQQIAVFSSRRAGDNAPTQLPAGAISNRMDSRGQPINGATVVLLDSLNTDFDLTGYAALGMKNLMRSLGSIQGRVALYSLGENLHMLKDFDEDPQNLITAATTGKVPPEIAKALGDIGDLLDLGKAQVHGAITRKALQYIIQRLARMPGRKNLVWLMPAGAPGLAQIVPAAQQANIAVYPVIVRSVGDSSVPFDELIQQHTPEGLAARTGGRAFFDAMDLTFAVQAAEEETTTAYVLGFYPEESTLDGKFHRIAVKLNDPKLHNASYEIRYRPGFLATKAPSSSDAVERIGLTAQLAPDPDQPGRRQMVLTVDLHDIRLAPKDGAFTGSFDLIMLIPGFREARSGTVNVNIPVERLGQKLEAGLTVTVGGIDAWQGDMRVVVKDQATGATGDLHIPIPKE